MNAESKRGPFNGIIITLALLIGILSVSGLTQITSNTTDWFSDTVGDIQLVGMNISNYTYTEYVLNITGADGGGGVHFYWATPGGAVGKYAQSSMSGGTYTFKPNDNWPELTGVANDTIQLKFALNRTAGTVVLSDEIRSVNWGSEDDTINESTGFYIDWQYGNWEVTGYEQWVLDDEYASGGGSTPPPASGNITEQYSNSTTYTPGVGEEFFVLPGLTNEGYTYVEYTINLTGEADALGGLSIYYETDSTGLNPDTAGSGSELPGNYWMSEREQNNSRFLFKPVPGYYPPLTDIGNTTLSLTVKWNKANNSVQIHNELLDESSSWITGHSATGGNEVAVRFRWGDWNITGWSMQVLTDEYNASYDPGTGGSSGEYVAPTLHSVGIQQTGAYNRLLGSNLGAWGPDSYWGINENLVKSEAQQAFATNVIYSFRFPLRPTLTDSAYLTLLDTIESVNAEPFFVLDHHNFSTGHVEKSVEMLELFGDRVTYYEYGNEVDWFHAMNQTEHAQGMCEGIPAMKGNASANGHSIMVGGPTQGNTDVAYMRVWAEEMQRICPEVIPDFVSFHKYWTFDASKSHAQILAEVESFNTEIEAIRAMVIDVFGEDLPLLNTEWNWHAVPENYADDSSDNASFIIPFTEAVLDEMVEANVYMAHQYDFGSSAGGTYLDMVTWDTVKPQYTVFDDWAEIVCTGCEAIYPDDPARLQIITTSNLPLTVDYCWFINGLEFLCSDATIAAGTQATTVISVINNGGTAFNEGDVVIATVNITDGTVQRGPTSTTFTVGGVADNTTTTTDGNRSVYVYNYANNLLVTNPVTITVCQETKTFATGNIGTLTNSEWDNPTESCWQSATIEASGYVSKTSNLSINTSTQVYLEPVEMSLRFTQDSSYETTSGAASYIDADTLLTRVNYFERTNWILGTATPDDSRINIVFGLVNGTNHTQYYEYMNTGTTNINDDLELLETADIIAWFEVVDEGYRPIERATIKAYLSEELANQSSSYFVDPKLFGRRLTDNNGKTFFFMDDNTMVTLVTSKDGHVSSTITLPAVDFSTSEDSPYQIVIPESTMVHDSRYYITFSPPSIFENRSLDIGFKLFAENAEEIIYTTNYRQTLGLTNKTASFATFYENGPWGGFIIEDYYQINLRSGSDFNATGTSDITFKIWVDGDYAGEYVIAYDPTADNAQNILEPSGLPQGVLHVILFLLLIGISSAVGFATRDSAIDFGVATFMMGSFALVVVSTAFWMLAAVSGLYFVAGWFKSMVND